LFLFSVGSGSVAIAPAEIIRILSAGGDSTEAGIIWKIRLPRTVMALILGGGLSVSGFLLQTYFDNPIAGPYILGISSGAKLAVALVLIFYVDRFHRSSSALLIFAAFLGALLVTGFILLISRSIRSMAALLVAGVMAGYISSALTELVITFAEDAEIARLHGWSQGSFSGVTWENIRAAAIIVGISMVLAMLLVKPMGAMRLGENYARSMGVNVGRFRISLILISSLLSACVTAFAGPVSFVGIAVPFLMRRLCGTDRPLVLVPACFAGGAAFCLFCDMIARTLCAPTELSISTVTAMFGAPVVIWMMIRRSGRGGNDG
jgi:iron complex transport system permease protein